MKKIFITRRINPIAKELLSKYFTIGYNNENIPLSVDKLAEVVKNYDGVLSTISEKFTSNIIAESNIKVISNYAIGLDNIDLIAAKNKGIAVFNTPDVVTESTADLTFALLLSLIRKIQPSVNFAREGKWSSWDPEIFLGEELFNKTIGIIGLGRVGAAVARRAKAFGMKVIYFDINPKLSKDYEKVSLDNLLENSDYISLHIPLIPQTNDLINKDKFMKMKKKPILLNLSRGKVLNTADLVESLKNQTIRGACLDVTDPEPLNSNHPLYQFTNCIITPHIGTATIECRYNMARLAAENIINFFKKEIL